MIRRDPYLNTLNCVDRLIAQYEKEGTLWIAYDFDDTVNDYHNQGHEYDAVIDLLGRAAEVGFKLICWTANPNIGDIQSRLKWTGLDKITHGININPPFVTDDPRKIYANIYLDDRGGLGQAVDILDRVIDKIKIQKLEEDRDKEIGDLINGNSLKLPWEKTEG